jgi:hypothetical protein
MAGKGIVLPPRAAPATARHVATAIAAVQRKVGGPPAGPNAGGRAPAPHVAASTAAVQRQPAAAAAPRATAPLPTARVPARASHVPAPALPRPGAVRPSPPALQARAPISPALPAARTVAPPAARRVAPSPTPPRPAGKSVPKAVPPDPRRRAQTLQAKFPLRTHFGHALSNRTLRELEAIQDLLKDRTRVKRALDYLESQIVEYVEAGESVKSALNLALQDEESRWMNPGRIKVATDSAITRQDPKATGGNSQGVARFPGTGGGGPLPPATFVSRALVPLRALKDVGAGTAHGEYAHRLQWYIISFWFRVNFTGDELRHLYLIMGSPNFVIAHPTAGGQFISLWDAVLDVRGAWATDMGPTGALYGGVDEVGFAVPGFLTGILTDDQLHGGAKVLTSYERFLHGERWSDALPHLSAAVTWRKLKRIAG